MKRLVERWAKTSSTRKKLAIWDLLLAAFNFGIVVVLWLTNSLSWWALLNVGCGVFMLWLAWWNTKPPPDLDSLVPLQGALKNHMKKLGLYP